MTDAFWEGRVALLACPSHVDGRGVLTPVTFADHGFDVVRAFVVTAPEGTERGGHGHRRGRQILMRVRGEIHVELVSGGQRARVVLDAATPALLVEAGIWSRQAYAGPDAALVVFCDTAYDPTDYFDAPEEAR